MNTRNFVFRVSPRHGERSGRFFLDAESDALPQGVPVVVTGDADSFGRAEVELATGAQDAPLPGKGGILVYDQFRMDGVDPVTNTYSDVDTVPAGKAVQVVSGDTVAVALKNTTSTSFLTRSDYPSARVMVAGVSIATPTVAVGDMLTPGDGNDTDGYWAETSTASEAWLIVTSVNASTGVVEARLNF